jgi:hypothetical protein
VVSAERSCFLLGDPAYDCVVPVADVVSELDVRDATVTGVLTHPADRDAQQLGDVGGGEETFAHGYGGRLA